MSTAPSLAQTVLSLFQAEDEMSVGEDGYDAPSPLLGGEAGRVGGQRHKRGLLSLATWRRYFKPLTVKAYYKSLFHLVVLNFPYALAAWVYLFVFTVVRLHFCSVVIQQTLTYRPQRQERPC